MLIGVEGEQEKFIEGRLGSQAMSRAFEVKHLCPRETRQRSECTVPLCSGPWQKQMHVPSEAYVFKFQLYIYY